MKSIRHIVLGLSLLALSGATRAETTDCTEITALSFTITQSGVYCLKASQTVNGGGIFVVANDVVIDLNGHVITNTSPTGGISIITQATQSNVTVRNGTIRGGTEAVNLTGPGHLVERLRIEGTNTGGIAIVGSGATIRNNVITGVTGPSCCNTSIFVVGYGARVMDNEILDVGLSAAGEANGIKIGDANGGVVSGNIIVNPRPDKNGGYPAGILVGPFGNSDMRLRVFGNHITNMGTGVFVTLPSNTTLLKDNVVSGTVTPFFGGVQVGTTNIVY